MLDLPGDVTASFYPDGSALLVGHDHAARSELYRYDLGTGALEKLDTPTGVVRGATARPDGTVELAWSNSELPPVVRRADGPVVLTVSEQEPPKAYPVEDRWVAGPGGNVHALLVRPASGGRDQQRRTRRRSWCTAVRSPPTTTPTGPAARPTWTPATPSCT